jgi:transposase-like protein
MMNQKNNAIPEGRLLSDQEREAFKMISTGNDLHGQRAIALLAIDGGATQAQAAQQSGLTAGQVKYWLGKFRQVRMEIFPEQILMADRDESQKKKSKKSGGKKGKVKSKKKKGKKKMGESKKKGKGKKKKNKK